MAEVLVVKSGNEQESQWEDAFARFDLEVRHWDAPGAPEEIDYALVWQPEPRALAGFPRLKLIFSAGAGLDHLFGENIVPPGIPVIRMVEDVLTAGMTEYVLYNVLRFHRFMPQYEANQRNRVWKELPQIPARERRVGILGLGVLGGDAAGALAALGFDVAGWSRTEKQNQGRLLLLRRAAAGRLPGAHRNTGVPAAADPADRKYPQRRQPGAVAEGRVRD